MAETQKRAASQSALRMPLNWMLGTQTNVRILRALYQLDVPIGVSELARYIKMDKDWGNSKQFKPERNLR